MTQPPNPSLVNYNANIPDISTHRGVQTIHRNYRSFNPIRRVLLNRYVTPKQITHVHIDLHRTGVAHVALSTSHNLYQFSWNKVIFLTVPQYEIMYAGLEWVRETRDFQFGTHASFVGFGMAKDYRPALVSGLLRFASPVTRIKQEAYVIPTPKGEAVLKAWLYGEVPDQNVFTQGFTP